MEILWILAVVTSANAFIDLNVNNDVTLLKYPDELNCSSKIIDWKINVDRNGLGVSFIVEQMNLDSDNGEHFIFSSDETFSGEMASVTYLTGALEDIRLAIPYVSIAYLRFSTDLDNCSSDLSFTLSIKQYEYAIPEPPATSPNPYPPSMLSTEIQIYLSGKNIEEFKNEDLQQRFKEAITEQAHKFCDKYEIEHNSTKLANETVFLRYPDICSSKWPDYENCVQVYMSVYVTLPKSEYHLTVAQMHRFWDEIKNDNLLQDFELQPYDFPDISVAILWWMLWIFIAVAITFGFGFFFWRIEKRSADIRVYLMEEEERKRREEIFSQVDLRNKPAVQKPFSKHQKLPESILNDEEVVILRKPKFTKKVQMPPKSPTSPTEEKNGGTPAFYSTNLAFVNDELSEA